MAKAYGAENLEKLQAGVRRDLENELKFKQDKDLRTELVRALLGRVNFELPETAVAQETRNVVYDLVQENTKRGVSREVIEKQKEQIYSAATQQRQRARQGRSSCCRRSPRRKTSRFRRRKSLRRVQHLAGHVPDSAGEVPQGPAEAQRPDRNL